VSASFRELEVWQLAMKLLEDIYALTRDFPSDERFGLAAQLRRAAVSIPSCIAEGHARPTTRDYIRFVGMSSGSVAEVETQLLAAASLGMVQADRIDEVIAKAERVGRMLNRLRSALEEKAKNG
jgi:four helix bundle protein